MLPSLREPWGIVVNEALAYGCPVIASERCGCAPELINNVTTGICFKPDDAASLCALLVEMLRKQWHTPEMIEARMKWIRDYNPSVAAHEMLTPLEA